MNVDQTIIAWLESLVSDKKRLDWLDGLTTFSWDCHTDNVIGSPTFDQIDKRTLFTIPSQHIDGANLREAIDAAIRIANK